MENFYGDTVRSFIGIVEDIRDPMRLGRVRVRVYGLHSANTEDIQVTDLPWAQVSLPTTEGGVDGIGRKSGLQVGALVNGIFLDGKNSQLPLITGAIPVIHSQSFIQERNSTTGASQADIPRSSTSPGSGLSGEGNRPTPLTDAGKSLVGGTNTEIAYNFFVASGFTPKQSAGIVGNLMQESGVNLSTTIKSAGSERSFGIAQWNSSKAAGNRLGKLKNFAKDIGQEWDDLNTQLRFIIFELEKSPFLGLALLRRSKTIRQAVIAFETKYERPSQAHRESRVSYAKDIHKRYNA